MEGWLSLVFGTTFFVCAQFLMMQRVGDAMQEAEVDYQVAAQNCTAQTEFALQM